MTSALFCRLLFLTALAAPAVRAEAAPFPPLDEDVTASPYAFAKSGGKATRAATEDAIGAKVIGGEVAAEGAWPWQVALIVAGAPAGVENRFCGGSPVLDRWMLTGAHCIHMPERDGSFFRHAAGRVFGACRHQRTGARKGRSDSGRGGVPPSLLRAGHIRLRHRADQAGPRPGCPIGPSRCPTPNMAAC